MSFLRPGVIKQHKPISFSGSALKSAERMKAAFKLQEEMNSDMGGTEIVEPFKAIYKQKYIPNYPRKVQQFLSTTWN